MQWFCTWYLQDVTQVYVTHVCIIGSDFFVQQSELFLTHVVFQAQILWESLIRPLASKIKQLLLTKLIASITNQEKNRSFY